MAFSSPSSERPPLRHLDLDALSDRELEALLFEGTLPKKQRSWLPGNAIGWAGLGAGTLLILALTAATEGVILVPLLVAAVVFAAVKVLSGVKGAFGCRRQSHASRSGGEKLARSTSDRKLMGVCGGLAAHFDIDATVVRLAFVLGLVATSGPPMVVAYLLLAYVLPSTPRVSTEERLRIIRES